MQSQTEVIHRRSRWIWIWLRPRLRELRSRLDRASKLEFLLDVVNLLAIVFQGLVTAYIGLYRQMGVVVHPLWACSFAVALVYTTLYNLWLRQLFRRKKWEREERRRSQSISVSISRLAACVRAGSFGPVDLEQIEHNLLMAVLSEIEAIVVDTEGIYLNVTLLIENPSAPDRLYGLNRARRDRDLYKSYPKGGMVAWSAMESGKLAYNPSFDSTEPYRAILALPILLREGEGTRSLGAISIDSEKDHHFDDREKKIELKLLPHMTLLKLVLVYRELYSAWPWRGLAADPSQGKAAEP